MEQHRMFVDTHLLKKPELASFRDLVMSVAETQRPSGRKPDSEKRWQNRTEKLAVHNEATMLDYILPLIMKTGRQVPVQDPSAHQASSTHPQMNDMWEDFEDSGLAWNVDREFRRTYLPNSYSTIGYHDKIATALAKERGMKNPKPDRTYGLAENSIPPPEDHAALLRDETKALLTAIPGLHHVFFLIEAVSSAGSLAKAINQASRGGTVAVHIQRLLLAALGQLHMDEGPDRQTYVYTATIDSSSMTFWVNFAYVRLMASGNKIVSYHMEHVFTYALRSKDAELYLRGVCHNILDWGVRIRRPMLEARCATIYESDRLAMEQDAAKVQQREAEAVEAAAAAAAISKEQGPVGKGKKRKLAPGTVSQGSL
ncbi:MAG: hypothetical protein Q9196_001911 [Gyalolechia fulgens]